jgi:hypothetical protein
MDTAPILRFAVGLMGRRGLAGCLACFCLWLPALSARVVRVEILSRADVASGQSFDRAGAYERITAQVRFAVDPGAAANRAIVDLGRAPRNRAGEVEFTADLCVLRPKDAARGNGTVLFEIPNRGRKFGLFLFDDAPAQSLAGGPENYGDGFLLRQGFVVVWVAWEFDVPAASGRLQFRAPVATEGGEEITGLVRDDFVVGTRTFDQSLGHQDLVPYPPVDPFGPDSRLTVRDGELGARQIIPRRDWSFGRWDGGRVVADPTRMALPGGFTPGRIYEVVYRAANPVVVGLGFAAVRDLGSYLKHHSNALASPRRELAFGLSQSGRFLRHFLYQGFNADESGEQVFDGLFIDVAGAGRGSFNHRFAQPSRDAGPYSSFDYPTDLFPFTDDAETDPVTGVTDGLLAEAERQHVRPKIISTFSSYEYWGRAVSLTHTTIAAPADAPLPANVRLYFFAGGQHIPGIFPPRRMQTANLLSPVDYRWSLRALLVALNRWAADDASPPPATMIPRLAAHTLVPPDAVEFPAVPGVQPPRRAHRPRRLDYGPDFITDGIVTCEPPRVGQPYPVWVPQVDRDGIDLGGVRLPEVAVPLGTFTGWNPRPTGTGAPGELVDYAGSYFPFARTRNARARTHDPRPSLEERYAGRAAYLAAVDRVTHDLVAAGFLRGADVAAVLAGAGARWDEANR